ncbi:large ribosomal subunit protein uL18m [Phymastichus coffea]|uniref:large ribosomal subunit protein uL18m n=1 Tax=Phymastichus coffea TaxID=108790 RepID=UPI00273C4AC2|nr:large ribosomal subunit protein uL18m [Phymastichus coffea]
MNSIRNSFLVAYSENTSYYRQVQTLSNASLLKNCVEVKNRNPRNLELMTIGRKPEGYHLDNPGRHYWHKLFVITSARHVNAEIHHFKNGAVVTVSTKEWSLKKQLYRTLDVSAFANVGRLLAQRCLESGISAVYCDIDDSNSKRYASLLQELKNGGISLEEPPVYKHANPWDHSRMVKPWTID